MRSRSYRRCRSPTNSLGLETQSCQVSICRWLSHTRSLWWQLALRLGKWNLRWTWNRWLAILQQTNSSQDTPPTISSFQGRWTTNFQSDRWANCDPTDQCGWSPQSRAYRPGSSLLVWIWGTWSTWTTKHVKPITTPSSERSCQQATQVHRSRLESFAGAMPKGRFVRFWLR